MRRVGDVELNEDMAHERREWIAQRIGWVVMGAIVAAALLGLFGSGPLAETRATAPGLELRYARFGRQQAISEVEVRFAAGSKMWLAAETVDSVEIERVTPEPVAVAREGGRYVFELAGAGPEKVVFTLRPRRIGWLSLRAGVPGGGEVAVRQLVFP